MLVKGKMQRGGSSHEDGNDNQVQRARDTLNCGSDTLASHASPTMLVSEPVIVQSSVLMLTLSAEARKSERGMPSSAMSVTRMMWVSGGDGRKRSRCNRDELYGVWRWLSCDGMGGRCVRRSCSLYTPASAPLQASQGHSRTMGRPDDCDMIDRHHRAAWLNVPPGVSVMRHVQR